MRRFEEQYRLNEGDDVLNRENAIHQDVDLRLDAVEQLGKAFAEGNRADIEAILKSLEQTFGTLAAEMRGLLDQTVGGLSADIVVETATRYFLTDTRRATILSDLRGGVDASADTLAKLLAKIVEATSARVARDGSTPMGGNLTIKKSSPILTLSQVGGSFDASYWNFHHFVGDGYVYFQNVDASGNLENSFSFKRGGGMFSAQMGDLKTYIDKGVRSDGAQGLSGASKLTAKKNVSMEIGRRYGVGSAYGIVGADLGALVYLEPNVPTLTVPLAANYTDGDYFWVYARGTLTVQATAGDPYTFGFADYNRSSFVMRPGDRCKIVMAGDAWDVVSYTTTHDKALMADRSITFSDAERQQLYANADIAIPHGQCRLNYVSATQIRLDGVGGNKLFINGNYRNIPSGGIATSNSGLAASTLYYVFAYWDAGTQAIKLAIGIGAPAVDPLYGHRVAGGQGSDAQNRVFTLVGMVYLNASGQFQSDASNLFVASWFNRRPTIVGGPSFSGAVAGGGSFINAGSPLYALSWDDLPIRAFANGTAYGGATGAQGQLRLLLDGGTVIGQPAIQTFYAANAYAPMPVQWEGKVTAGVHSLNAQVYGTGGGANFTSDLGLEAWI